MPVWRTRTTASAGPGSGFSICLTSIAPLPLCRAADMVDIVGLLLIGLLRLTQLHTSHALSSGAAALAAYGTDGS